MSEKVNVTVIKPREGKWFQVNPLAIDQKLFKKERKDLRQESTRNLILEAFTKIKENPEKYGRSFQTMIPNKTWESKTIKELKELATSLGDCVADWVHQVLEWAQRIANGESWEAVCNETDTANWYRLVVWKNNYARFFGGSSKDILFLPASHINDFTHYPNNSVNSVVPLVVLYNTKTTKKDIPTESKWFNVNPLAINQKLFKKEREDLRQESTRNLILEAFTKVNEYPEKYGRSFQTMIPNKTWESKTIKELKELATSLGDCVADWVHQVLEWAQRIANGESWEAVCNETDTANWYRLVVWKNGYSHLVGGSHEDVLIDCPASHVYDYDYDPSSRVKLTVPLVVSYNK